MFTMARFLPLILLFLLSILASEVQSTSKLSKPIQISLKHIDATGNFSKTELLQRAVLRSKQRRNTLTAKNFIPGSDHGSAVQAPVFAGNGEFLMDLSIGTPSVTFKAIVDTGSDLVWTQCQSCDGCPPSVYDPSQSSTFITTVPCDNALCQSLPQSRRDCSPGCTYDYVYGDRSSTSGPLATETITFDDSVSVSGMTFGCSSLTQGYFDLSNGLVGLGQGPLSLISQLGSPCFWYCFTSFTESASSPLKIGPFVLQNGHSTPIVPNPDNPSFYYISLLGITVGSTILPIPSDTFAINSDGTGGMIIDSGTSITSLDDVAYQLLKQEFLSQVSLTVGDGSSMGFDLCFELPSDPSTVTIPTLTFNFDGADMRLPENNYFSETSGLKCLTILSGNGMSIFGNHQQQNLLVLYDRDDATLSFVDRHCDQL